MKKKLMTLVTAVGLLHSYAQIWNQNFSSPTVPALPLGWTQVNVDGLTVNSALNAYNFGSNAWVTRDFTSVDPLHGKVGCSTSYYAPAGTSNDWLITPSFTVPANGVLRWDALAVDPSFPDGYRVLVSSTGTNLANFTTTLLTVSAENGTWTNRNLNLNAYAGQTLNIAFVNRSTDKFVLFLDNIELIIPPASDGELTSITGLTRYMAGAGNQTIAGVFTSYGYNPANTAVLNYKVNNGATVTQTMTFATPLNYGQSNNYNFTTLANLGLGTNKIKVWVTSVNGVSEVNTTNDTAVTYVYVASTTKPRKALIEEWSSSTCVPCAALNVTNGFDALLNSNNPNKGGNVNVVKYQMNWPNPGNDPSYNGHGLSRRAHYGINGVPSAIVNGRTKMVAHSQAEINAANR